MLGIESLDSRIVCEDCSVSSSFSSLVAAARIAEELGRSVCEGNVDSRNCCLCERFSF